MKKRLWIMLLAALALVPAFRASADTLSLPAGLRAVEEEAFSGALSLDEVVLPEGIESIGSKAFAGSGVRRVYLPESLSYIAEDAFEGCGTVTGFGPEDTYASAFFDTHDGLSFEHKPRYFALLVGNADYNLDGDLDDSGDLEAPKYDVEALEPVLTGLNPAWSVTVRRDLRSNEMVSAIHEAFDGTRSSDVCLFYYSGHGAVGGVLSCVMGSGLTAQSLAEELDLAAKGNVIVLLDCCYSGATITPKGTGTAGLTGFNSAVISAFSGYTLENGTDSRSDTDGITPRNGELIREKFHVLTACSSDQISIELKTSAGYSYGLMTNELIDALGCSFPSGAYSGTFRGDSNGDSRLTLGEAQTFITGQIDARKAKKQADLIDKRDTFYENWKAVWQANKWYDGKYYSVYDDYFQARYDFEYHAYDQITSISGDREYVLFER